MINLEFFDSEIGEVKKEFNTVAEVKAFMDSVGYKGSYTFDRVCEAIEDDDEDIEQGFLFEGESKTVIITYVCSWSR